MMDQQPPNTEAKPVRKSGFQKGRVPHNKKLEKERDKLKRLKLTIELPPMLWCAETWIKIAMRLANAAYNRKRYRMPLICGLQLTGISEETTRQIINKSLEQNILQTIRTKGFGIVQYDVTAKGKNFVMAITSCSEVMTRKSFDEEYPFASNLHNSKGHRFKSKF